MMLPSSLRLFIALELPPPVLEALAKLQLRLKNVDSRRAFRWSALEGIHLTLKFLGETPTDRVNSIRSAMERAAQGQGVITLGAGGTGCFPNTRKPRVVWAGVSGDLSALHHLHDRLEREVSPLGFPTEDRPFSPHLTLARARQEASGADLGALGTLIAGLQAEAMPTWTAESVCLMRSEPTPAGSVYTRLAEVPFKTER